MTFFAADAQTQCHFDESTPYALRFGADQCGYRREIIFKISRSCSKTKKIIEHSLYPRLALPFSQKSRLLTLIIKPEGAFTILLDGRVVRKGDIFENMTPPWPRPSSTIGTLPTDFPTFNAVGLAFMAMDSGTLIDNIVISYDLAAAQLFSRSTFWQRARVEHMVAETALRTRSAVRQEIRSKRHEFKLLNTVALSKGDSYLSTDSSIQIERILQDTGNSSTSAGKTEELGWTSPSRRNWSQFEVCPKPEPFKESTSKCGLSTGDVKGDALLNILLVVSTFAAGIGVLWRCRTASTLQ